MIIASMALVFAACQKETPFVSVNNGELNFTGSPSTMTVNFESNSAWTVTNTNDWITVSPMSGTGNGTLKVSVTLNETLERTGTVTISVNGDSLTLTVKQTSNPICATDKADFEFGAEGGTDIMSVLSNRNWSLTGQDGCDWVKFSPATGTPSTEKVPVTITVSANEGVDRETSITIVFEDSGHLQYTFPIKQAGSSFEYGGVVYKTITMKDGRTWMASPLKYVPEGKTPSSDPTDGSGFWYAYTSDGSTCTPVTDGSTGYLYDYPTAFGAEVNAENYKGFEGTRGICPEGWHIPTRAEFVNLVGNSVKGAGEDSELIKEDAAYYDEEYKGGRISALDADGFGWSFLGCVNVTNPNALDKGSYQKLVCDQATCSVEGYIGKNRLTYVMSSTGNSVNASNGNIQFFGLMSTFTKTYPEGRLHAAFANYRSGFEVRCIKD